MTAVASMPNPYTYGDGSPIHGGEGLARVDDSDLVTGCLALGGFPRVFVLDGKAFWLDAQAREWRFGHGVSREISR